jgi:hypothetical protein
MERLVDVEDVGLRDDVIRTSNAAMANRSARDLLRAPSLLKL